MKAPSGVRPQDQTPISPSHEPRGLLQALRDATRDVHRHLEEEAGLTGLAASPAAYARHLTRLAAAEAPLVRALERVRPPSWWSPAPPLAGRLAALCEDLAALGVPGPPEVRAVPEIRTPGHALGVAYVLEGSALGNAVVLAEVRRRLDDAVPVGYLEWPGGGAGRRFSRLASALRDRPGTGREAAEACDGAVLAFGVFRAAMTAVPGLPVPA